MGPQHDSCGRTIRAGACGIRGRPSMGPQHDSCGRGSIGGFLAAFRVLQWGRNMIVAEGFSVRLLDQVAHPSMGPQHDSCGRSSCASPWAAQRCLQWGRNMIVAEGTAGLSQEPPMIRLQWGRNMIVAEGVLARRHAVRAGEPSMGPQHDSCGRKRTDICRD